LVTTKWTENSSSHQIKRERRVEQVLKDKYWAPMIKKGAQPERHDGSLRSAIRLLTMIVDKPVQPMEDGDLLDGSEIVEEVWNVNEHLRTKYDPRKDVHMGHITEQNTQQASTTRIGMTSTASKSLPKETPTPTKVGKSPKGSSGTKAESKNGSSERQGGIWDSFWDTITNFFNLLSKEETLKDFGAGRTASYFVKQSPPLKETNTKSSFGTRKPKIRSAARKSQLREDTDMRKGFGMGRPAGRPAVQKPQSPEDPNSRKGFGAGTPAGRPATQWQGSLYSENDTRKGFGAGKPAGHLAIQKPKNSHSEKDTRKGFGAGKPAGCVVI
jgi:hypothetical protein